MANKSITMVQIRRILQLVSAGSSKLGISKQMQVHRKTIDNYISKLKTSGKTAEELLQLDDKSLRDIFFKATSPEENMKKRVSLKIFAIVMSALLAFGGGAGMVMAADAPVGVAPWLEHFDLPGGEVGANPSVGMVHDSCSPSVGSTGKIKISCRKGTVCPGNCMPREKNSPSVEKVLSKKISAAKGGTIIIPEALSERLAGVELHIPPGALAEDTVITVGEVVNGLLSVPKCCRFTYSAISLEPSGLTFQKPVTLLIPLPEGLLLGEDNTAVEDIILKKYSKDSNTWTNISVKYVKNNTIVAEIESFCYIWGLIPCRNPACWHRILTQARQWRPLLSDTELEKILKDPNMFVDSDVTFEDKIRHLLLAESLWDKIQDGEFYEGFNLLREATEVVGKEILTYYVSKRFGLVALKGVSKIGIIVIPFDWGAALAEELAINTQLKAYLSWRGWFFEEGGWFGEDRWNFNEQLAWTHEEIMSLPPCEKLGLSRMQRSDASPNRPNNWFYYKEDGTLITLRSALPENMTASTLFNEIGKPIYDLLHNVRNNKLAADREQLSRMFSHLAMNRPVANAGDDQTVVAGTQVILDGSASFDPNNDELGFTWLYRRGEAGTWWFLGSGAPREEFTPTEPGIYTISLRVNDGSLNSNFDRVTINALPWVDIPPGDITPPTTNSFSAEPVSITVGTPVTIRFTAADNTGGSGISRIVLNRAEGEPVYWEAIAYYCFERQNFFTLKGNNRILGPWPWDGPVVSGAIQDTPPSAGAFWYGLQVIDKAGNLNCEQNSRTNNQPGDFGPDKVQVEIDPNVLPDLTITSVGLSKTSAQVGDTLSVTFTIENRGGPLTDNFRNLLFLSTRRFGGHGAQNVFLAKFPMSLDGAISKTATVEVTIPDVAAGDWYVAVFTDGTMVIDERNEMNNIDSRAISITTLLELTGIAITPETPTVPVGATRQFTAAPIPVGAPLGEVTWSVDNEAVGTIDATGLFRAISAGIVTVTAMYANVTGTGLAVVFEAEPVIPELTLLSPTHFTLRDHRAIEIPQDGFRYTPMMPSLLVTSYPYSASPSPVTSVSPQILIYDYATDSTRLLKVNNDGAFNWNAWNAFGGITPVSKDGETYLFTAREFGGMSGSIDGTGTPSWPISAIIDYPDFTSISLLNIMLPRSSWMEKTWTLSGYDLVVYAASTDRFLYLIDLTDPELLDISKNHEISPTTILPTGVHLNQGFLYKLNENILFLLPLRTHWGGPLIFYDTRDHVKREFPAEHGQFPGGAVHFQYSIGHAGSGRVTWHSRKGDYFYFLSEYSWRLGWWFRSYLRTLKFARIDISQLANLRDLIANPIETIWRRTYKVRGEFAPPGPPTMYITQEPFIYAVTGWPSVGGTTLHSMQIFDLLSGQLISEQVFGGVLPPSRASMLNIAYPIINTHILSGRYILDLERNRVYMVNLDSLLYYIVKETGIHLDQYDHYLFYITELNDYRANLLGKLYNWDTDTIYLTSVDLNFVAIDTPLTGISITPETATVAVGATQLFTASPIPEGAVLGEVTWSVDNPAVGTVDATGLFTALAAGTVNVRATSIVAPNITGTATVTVTAAAAPPPPQLHVTPTTVPGSLVQGTGWTNIGTVNVTNPGGGALSWSAVGDRAWIEITPTSGTTTTETDSVTVQLTTAGLTQLAISNLVISI